MADPSLLRFRLVIEAALAQLESRREEVNDLNVFPVADGDTGDNMALTLRAVLTELDNLSTQGEIDEIGREQIVDSVARAALLGARGNAGVILSQLIRGAAEELISRPGELVDPVLVAAAMARAADRAYGSVRDPAEGTILTVVREMAARAASEIAHMAEPRLQHRVDDSGLLEHRELVGPLLDRLLGGLQRPLEHVGDQRVLLLRAGVGAEPLGVHVREILRDAVRHRAHGAQHRPLGGVADRVGGGVGGARGGRCDEDGVDQLTRPRRQLLGRPADDLRQDHAAVAARAEQRRAGDRRDDFLAADDVERLSVEDVELVHHGAHRHRHVVAGVAVGDREHVQVVHLAPAALQLVQRGRHHAAEADQALVGHRRGSTPRAGLVSVRVPGGTAAY